MRGRVRCAFEHLALTLTRLILFFVLLLFLLRLAFAVLQPRPIRTGVRNRDRYSSHPTTPARPDAASMTPAVPASSVRTAAAAAAARRHTSRQRSVVDDVDSLRKGGQALEWKQSAAGSDWEEAIAENGAAYQWNRVSGAVRWVKPLHEEMEGSVFDDVGDDGSNSEDSLEYEAKDDSLFAPLPDSVEVRTYVGCCGVSVCSAGRPRWKRLWSKKNIKSLAFGCDFCVGSCACV